MIEYKNSGSSLIFSVRVIPRSSKTEIVGEHDGALKVKLRSPPVEGAANAEIVKMMAKSFGVARSAVSIISGETSRNKRVRVEGGTVKRLQELAAG
ncbi:MAG: DUF167 domain-containing protein [Pyrinomonadaceae bacterium]